MRPRPRSSFRSLLRAAVKRGWWPTFPSARSSPVGSIRPGRGVHGPGRERAGCKTFTIGFADGSDYDETAHARAVVADHFGTDHTEFVVEPKALELIDRLVWHHDGPFGDSSAVPTYLLSELTQKHGDGGAQRRRGRRGVRGVPAVLRRRALRARAPLVLPGACVRWSGCCRNRRTASIRCGSPSVSRRRESCPCSSATCAGTRTSRTTSRGC